MVDATDLKSVILNDVPVRVRLPAPYWLVAQWLEQAAYNRPTQVQFLAGRPPKRDLRII